MKAYLDLLQDILYHGELRKPSRPGMPPTIEVFNRTIRHNFSEGLPLLTTKKMYLKGIIVELIWFLRGDTNIKYLVDNGCNIWNGDAYKHYKRLGGILDMDQWLEAVKSEALVSKYETEEFCYKTYDYKYGDCGRIYGHQWRNFSGGYNGLFGFDQIEYLLDSLKNKPESRYHLCSAWNPMDFFMEGVALPACHVMFQFYVRDNKYLDISVIQRSCDTFLGVPFNLASYAILNIIFSNVLNLIPGELIWTGQCVHIYENHREAVDEQLKRVPRSLPRIHINKKLNSIEDIENLKYEDFVLEGYDPYPSIKAPLSVGI